MFRTLYSASTQTLRRVPMGMDGRPILLPTDTTVTVTIRDARESTDEDPISTQSVTRADVTGTLTGASGYGQADPRAIAAPDTGLEEGRAYLLQGADGTSEMFVLETSQAAVQYARTHLRGRYAASDTVTLLELVASIPGLAGNDNENLRRGAGPFLATWSFTHDGQSYQLTDTFFLDRYSLEPPIDEAYMLQAAPMLADRLRDRARPSDAIAVAYQDAVAEIEAADKDPSTFFPSTTFRVAVRHGAIAYAYDWVSSAPEDLARAEAHRSLFNAKMRTILTGQAPARTVQLDRVDETAKEPRTGFEILRRS